jgi:hypothetical protein
MRKVILLVVCSVLWCGYAKAQQVTGPAAEEAKQQVMQIEKEKVPLMLKGGNAFADWLYKMDAEDALFIGTYYHRSKAEEVVLWRSGKIKESGVDEHDYHAYIYDNGNLAIVTYMATSYQTVNGGSHRSTTACEDSWVRQDGRWLRTVHFTAETPTHGSKESAE